MKIHLRFVLIILSFFSNWLFPHQGFSQSGTPPGPPAPPGYSSLEDGRESYSSSSPEPPGGGEGSGGGGGTLTYPPAYSYTNGLWIEMLTNTVDSTWIYLNLHGTVSDQYYDILSKSDLGEANWALEFGLIGVDGTTTIPAFAKAGRTNSFFEARATTRDIDGDGLPDWYETQFTGTDPALGDTGDTGVSDNDKDSDGDGWSNYAEYQNGTSPGAFNTPPAPQGVVLVMSTNQSQAVLSWLPSLGSVTGYVVERVNVMGSQTSTNLFSLPSGNTAYDDTNILATYFPGWSNSVYRVKAVYGLNSSLWSLPVDLADHTIGGQISWVNEQSGQIAFTADNISTNLWGYRFYGMITDSTTGTTITNLFDVAATNFVNGVYSFSDPQKETLTYVVGDESFWYQWLSEVAVAPIGNRGQLGIPTLLSRPYFDEVLDGSAYLKQNLSLLLRAANVEELYNFSEPWAYFYNDYVSPRSDLLAVGYRYFFDSYFWDGTHFDPLKPAKDNALLGKFLYDPAKLTISGNLSGIHYNFSHEPPRSLSNAPSYCLNYPANFTPEPLIVSQEDTAISYSFNQWLSGEAGLTWSSNGVALSAGFTNLFGLQYSKAIFVGARTNGLQVVEVSAGNQAMVPSAPTVFIYTSVERPLLETADYIFMPINTSGSGGYNDPPIPGDIQFANTNESSLIIAPVGQTTTVAGWAKQRIINGCSNKFAYLEQYFDKAYKATNGIIDTNQPTGIISGYGDFFPTEPGRTILTTRPDSDQITNSVGYCSVYAISMNVDANHDGIMDRSWRGPDNTSEQRPFRFWINNDYDSSGEDKDYPLRDSDDNVIASQRDLEDFARLWISGIPTLAASEGYSISLSWRNVEGSPSLKLYSAYESDGGVGYLTNATIAGYQTITANLNGLLVGAGASLGTVSPSLGLTFTNNIFTNGQRKHFLFEGISIGKGELLLTIYKGTNIISETGVWIDLKNVKDLYERAHVENVANIFPLPFDNSVLKVDKVLGIFLLKVNNS